MSLDIETVHSMMLDTIGSEYRKEPGSAAWDITRAFAVAVVSLSDDVDEALRHLDVWELTGQDLDEYIRQHRGMIRKYADYAEATLTVVTGAGDIEAGDLFATESGITFQAISDTTVTAGSTFEVRAVQAGASGNVGAGPITQFPVTIAGIAAVTNAADASGGTDGETDDDFRSRFMSELQTPNNGANQAAYISWAESITGVGRAKVFVSGNTVEVCICDQEMQAPASSLVAEVQAYIDPTEDGTGTGVAPIGAACTVSAATNKTVNVSATLTLETGYTVAGVTDAITEALGQYMRSLALRSDAVSITKVGAIIVSVEGVSDYSALKLNNATSNVALTSKQVPKLGTVTLS